jgi:dihydropteroate synthase
VGASRKSFLLADLPPAPPADRLAASLAAATHSALHGVHALRVHDVFETLQAVAVARSLAAPAAGGAA